MNYDTGVMFPVVTHHSDTANYIPQKIRLTQLCDPSYGVLWAVHLWPKESHELLQLTVATCHSIWVTYQCFILRYMTLSQQVVTVECHSRLRQPWSRVYLYSPTRDGFIGTAGDEWRQDGMPATGDDFVRMFRYLYCLQRLRDVT